VTPRWKALEASLRRRVRAELRASRELWREYKRNRRSFSRQTRLEPFIRFLVPIALAAIALAGTSAPALVLAALTLYATGSAFLRAASLLQGLHGSTDLNVLAHYPCSDDDLLRLQWRRFHRSSLWLLYTFAVVYLVLGAGGGPAALALSAGLALVHWLGTLGVSAALAAWRPAWPLPFLGKALCLLSAAPVVFGKALGPLLEGSPGLGFLALPTGWASFAFRNGIVLGEPWALAAALPAAALAALVPLAGRRFLRTYSVGGLVYPAAPTAELILEQMVQNEMVRRSEYDPAVVESPELKPALREELRRSIPEFMEGRVLEGGFLRAPDWTRGGPLERAFAALLSPRERAAADFLLGGGMSWTRSWILSAVFAALGSLGVLLLGGPVPWVVVSAGALMALPLLAGTWPAFHTVPTGGVFMPLHALYPLGYWQMSSLKFRAALVRGLAWAPLAFGFAVLIGAWPGTWIEGGPVLALKALAVYAASVPVFAIFRFSEGTNDTERPGCLGAFLFLPIILTVLAAAAGAILLFVPELGFWKVGLPLLALPPFLAWALYGLLYTRCRVDLLRATPSST